MAGRNADGGGRGTDEYLRFFPYDEPYPNQHAAMDGINNALARGQDVLLEGAPGTGKTLSALVPALEHAREHDRTVAITTSVHQQMRQFVADARAITREEPIRAVVFRGKSSMCHVDVDYRECQALRDTTRSVVESERERDELRARADELLDAMAEGDETASEAYEAVQAELEAVEAEIEDRDAANVCEHYRANLTRDDDAFFAWLFDDVRTPDEVYEFADERGLCGYELLKEGMEGVDLVVCNYHHLLDPTIREQFFRWLDRDPAEVVTVFDEAHNVADAAREHASRTLTERTLSSALAEIEEVEDSRAGAAANVLGAFREALERTWTDALGFGEREQVGDDWHDLAVANDDRRDDLTLAFLDAYEGPGIETEVDLALQLGKHLDEEYDRAFTAGETTTRRECQTLQAADFLAAWMDGGGDPGRHPLVAVRRDAASDELYGRAELFTCIPRAVTADLFDRVHASVLMSATLRPFDVTEDVLGLDSPATLSFGLPYPEEHRRTYAVEGPALFASERDDPATQETVAATLADVVRFTPGNVLAFFPSYAEAERYHDLLFGTDGLDATPYLDEPGVRAEDLRRRFVDDGDGVLCTSLWGTLAEGVSFDGDDARAVVVVGVPYPHLDERMEAVEDAYDRTYGDGTAGGRSGWDYAVEIPTVRKTRQALGRVIRSPDDFGVRVLLDKRYTRESRDMGAYGVRGTFPPEERDELVDVAPEKLKFAMLNFFSDLDAYDGEPPRPE
ncbi:MAG: ATP-dependent DNA helicase [Haloferacaceae archaeon]